MSKTTGNLSKVKLAFQLSFIFWVMLGILFFYAAFEEQSRMLGTFLLLCSVILFTPFLPDGTDLPEGAGNNEIENLQGCTEESLKKV